MKLFTVLSSCNLYELFLHSTCNITNYDLDIYHVVGLSLHCSDASYEVNKYILVVRNPTDKQIALALQMEPLIFIWKFLCCKLDTDLCKQFSVLSIFTKQLDELEFSGCDIGSTEVNTFYNFLISDHRSRGPNVMLKKLYISSSSLTISMA